MVLLLRVGTMTSSRGIYGSGAGVDGCDIVKDRPEYSLAKSIIPSVNRDKRQHERGVNNLLAKEINNKAPPPLGGGQPSKSLLFLLTFPQTRSWAPTPERN